MKHKPIKPQLYGCLNCSPIPSAKLSKKHKWEIYGEIRLRIDDKTIGDWLHESPTVKSIEKQYREQIDKGKLPDKEGLWTFYGGKFAKENLIELLQAIVAQVNQSYRFLEQSINEYNTVNKISEIVDRDLTSLDDPWDMLSQVSKAILECKSRRGSVASKQTNDKKGG